MPSFEQKPISIALFPTAADRSTLIPNSHQQHYLSPPLTPFLQFPSYNEKFEPFSPIKSPPHLSLPAFREMLPHEDQQKLSPTDPDRHAYPASAPQQHLEHDMAAIQDPNSASTPRGAPQMTDPSRLLPLYTSQSHTPGLEPSGMVSPLLRRNKAHVASACVNCKKAHLACDGKTPRISLFLYLRLVYYPLLSAWQ